nr:hypothetical protein [Alistipes onderdonkii]
MGWQDFAVWGIGIVVAAVVLRRMWCFFRGRGRGGCASCAGTHCALKTARRRGRGGNGRP